MALVGSWARDDAGADSDVDLVLLVDEPEAYLVDDMWANGLGAASILRTKSWGAVTERRLSLPSGFEVDTGSHRRLVRRAERLGHRRNVATRPA